MLKDKKEVVKHSAAIQISNKITLLQRRCWNLLLANAYDDLLLRERFFIDIKELSDALCFESKNLDYLKKSLEALVNCTVKWNVLGKDKEQEWGVATLLSEVKIKKGIVAYSYAPTIREKLYNPSMYARISLIMQNKFSSRYSLAFYELFVDYFMDDMRKGETPFIEIDDLKVLLGIENGEYADFHRFKNKVLLKAIKEINDRTDFEIDFSYKKSGRKIQAIKFIIKTKKDLEKPAMDDFKKDKYFYYFSLLQKRFLLNSEQVEEVLEKYTDYEILDSFLKEIEAKYKNKEIANLGAYTYKFLMKHPGVISEIDLELKKEKEEKEKILREVEKEKLLVKKLYEKFSEEKNKKISDYIRKNRNDLDEFLVKFRNSYRLLLKHHYHKNEVPKDIDVVRDLINKNIILMKMFREFLAKNVLPSKYYDFIEYAKSKKVDLVKVGEEYYLKDGYAVKVLN